MLCTVIVDNPMLSLSEFRTNGRCRHPHGGDRPRLGIGQNRGLGWSSPVEANFVETTEGRSARGTARAPRFYRVRQDLVRETTWQWTHHGSGRGTWRLTSADNNQQDNPDPTLVTFNTTPVGVSFFDSPGFPVMYFLSVAPDVHRVCALQNFRLWVEVVNRPEQGSFQAASDVLWHHLLCLNRVGTSWTVEASQSMLGRGELRLASPFGTESSTYTSKMICADHPRGVCSKRASCHVTALRSVTSRCTSSSSAPIPNSTSTPLSSSKR